MWYVGRDLYLNCSDTKFDILVIGEDTIASVGLRNVLMGMEFVDSVESITDSVDAVVQRVLATNPRVVVGTSLLADVVHHTKAITRLRCASAVVLISDPGPVLVDTVLAGATSAVSWRASVAQLAAAIRTADQEPNGVADAAGRTEAMEETPPLGRTVHLSDRETEVILRAAEGQKNSSIARKMLLSEATVKTYWRRVFKKLDVNDRTTAVATAMATGALPLACSCVGESRAQWSFQTRSQCQALACVHRGEMSTGQAGNSTEILDRKDS